MEPQGVNGHRTPLPGAPREFSIRETCAGCPQQRYTMGEPGKVHGRDRVGIVDVPVGTAPAGSVIGEICFIEKPGVQDEGGRHAAKRSSDPRVAYPKLKFKWAT